MSNEEEKKSFVFKDKRGSSESTPDTQQEKPGDSETKLDDTADSKSDKSTASSKRAMPKIDFPTFIISLSSSAAMNLGGYQDPVSGHIPKNLELAKQSIDILAIIQEKTKGNLSKEEAELLDTSLYELRMRYVEEIKKG